MLLFYVCCQVCVLKLILFGNISTSLATTVLVEKLPGINLVFSVNSELFVETVKEKTMAACLCIRQYYKYSREQKFKIACGFFILC